MASDRRLLVLVAIVVIVLVLAHALRAKQEYFKPDQLWTISVSIKKGKSWVTRTLTMNVENAQTSVMKAQKSFRGGRWDPSGPDDILFRLIAGFQVVMIYFNYHPAILDQAHMRWARDFLTNKPKFEYRIGPIQSTVDLASR